MHSLSLSWGGRFFCSPSLFIKVELPPIYFLYTEGNLVSSFFVHIYPGFTDKKIISELIHLFSFSYELLGIIEAYILLLF